MKELITQLNAEVFKSNAVDDQLSSSEVEAVDDGEDDFSRAFSNETMEGMLVVIFIFTTSDAIDTQ